MRQGNVLTTITSLSEGFKTVKNMAKLRSYQRVIVKTLKESGLYTPQLAMQVENLACALYARDMAARELDGLESVCVEEVTRYGKRKVAHPAFRVMKEAMSEVSKQMTSLKLTVADLIGSPEGKNGIDGVVDKIAAIKL